MISWFIRLVSVLILALPLAAGAQPTKVSRIGVVFPRFEGGRPTLVSDVLIEAKRLRLLMEIYSGIFALLALQGARDWRLG